MCAKSSEKGRSENLISLQTLLLGDLGNKTGKSCNLPSFTCRLLKLDPNKNMEIKGIASGFIAERSGSLFLLSAGHVLSEGLWCLETDVSFKETNETLLIPLDDVLQFKTVDLITKEVEGLEFAFARLDTQKLQQEADKIGQRLQKMPIKLRVYSGPLDEEPVVGQANYSYASWHSKESALYTQVSTSRYRFDRQASGEFGMAYEGRSADGKLYRFKLADAHKGHDYYRGASGSPIVDPGYTQQTPAKVVSMLVRGEESTRTLYGLAIRDYLPLIDLAVPSKSG